MERIGLNSIVLRTKSDDKTTYVSKTKVGQRITCVKQSTWFQTL